MSKAGPVADEDRLPWLEPYRESPARGGQLPRRGYGKPIVAGVTLGLVLAAAGGGFWLGQRDYVPSRGSDSVVLAPPRQEPVRIAQAPETAPVQQAPVEAVEPAPPQAKAPAAKKSSSARVKKYAKRRASGRRKIRTAGVDSSRLKAIRAAQERTVPRQAWPKMPSPGPAGQVIQLGAFTTPYRANAAYRVRLARYPALQRMPRVVVPIITQPRRRVLYVLRLGTTSRQHSHTVCNNLRRSGDHCLVIG